MNSVEPPRCRQRATRRHRVRGAPTNGGAPARDHFDPGPERRLGLAEKFDRVLRDLLACFDVERNDS